MPERGARRLTRLDEHPRHQLGETFDVVADGSPHWSDGYYFTMGDDDGRYAWFMGFRLHANNDVLDAFTCVSADDGAPAASTTCAGRAGCGRASTTSTAARFSVEIVEGLRTLRIRCAENEHGQAYDLLFEGWCPPYNEDHVQVVVNGRLQSDRSNYDQCCVVTGWFEVAGGAGRGRWLDRCPRPLVGDRQQHRRPAFAGDRSAADTADRHRGCASGACSACPIVPSSGSSTTPAVTGLPTKFESRCMFPYGDERESFAYTAVDHDVAFEEVDGRAVPRLAEGDGAPDPAGRRRRALPDRADLVPRVPPGRRLLRRVRRRARAAACTAATTTTRARCGRSTG